MLMLRTGCAELPLCWGQAPAQAALSGLTDPQLRSGATSHGLCRSSQPGWAELEIFCSSCFPQTETGNGQECDSRQEMQTEPQLPTLTPWPQGMWGPSVLDRGKECTGVL